jgi:hypothetical protein
MEKVSREPPKVAERLKVINCKNGFIKLKEK